LRRDGTVRVGRIRYLEPWAWSIANLVLDAHFDSDHDMVTRLGYDTSVELFHSHAHCTNDFFPAATAGLS
jgi:hypothetical protein